MTDKIVVVERPQPDIIEVAAQGPQGPPGDLSKPEAEIAAEKVAREAADAAEKASREASDAAETMAREAGLGAEESARIAADVAEQAAREAADAVLLEHFFDDGAQHELYVYNVNEFFEALASMAEPAPYLPGTWRVHIEENSYIPSAEQMLALPASLGSRMRIKLMGPDVGGHPNDPVAVIDMKNVPKGLTAGIRNYVWEKDLKIINADRAKTGGTTSSFVQLGGSDVWYQNCHSDAIDAYAAYFAQGASRIYVDGGKVTGKHFVGPLAYNTQLATIGYRATSVAEGPIIKGTSFAGAYLVKSYADVFFTTVDNCGRGMLGDYGSRARLRSCVIKNNIITGLHARGGSHYNGTSFTDVAKLNTFENNGPAGKGPTIVPSDTSSEFLGQIKLNPVGEMCHFRSSAPAILTGTTAATNMSAPNNFNGAPAWWLGQGGRFRIQIIGLLAGLLGAKTLSFRLNTSILTSCKTPRSGVLLIPSDSVDPRAGIFRYTAEALFTTDGKVRSWSKLEMDGMVPILDTPIPDKEIALTGAESLRVYGQLGDAADSIEARTWDYWVSPPKLDVIVEEEPPPVEE